MKQPGSNENTSPHWYCVRSQPSRQNVAAAHLRSFGIEVFNPHMRLKKATRLGVLWRNEPLFPNYLFARFDLTESQRRVRYAFGVTDIVRFGATPRAVAEAEIAGLREQWGPSEEYLIEHRVKPGDTVKLSGRLFHGVEAEVLCLLPARQRVKVLIEFLGGPKEADEIVRSGIPEPIAPDNRQQ
jgi:transcriptional antiterminator RfaH